MIVFLLTTIAELLVCTALRLSGLAFNADVVSWLLVAISGAALLISLDIRYRGKDCQYVFGILTASFFTRIAALLWDLYGRGIWIFPNSGHDTELFQNQAELFYNGYTNVSMPSKTFGSIYCIFLNDRILAQYFNLILSILSLMICNAIFEKLGLAKKFRKGGLILAAFLPNYIILSVILLRESIVIFLLTASLYFFLNWWQNNRVLPLIAAMSLSLIAAIYHSGAIASALGYTLVLILCSNRERKLKITASSLLLASLFFVGFVYLYIRYQRTFFGYFGNLSLDRISDEAVHGLGGSGSDYFAGGEGMSSISQFLLFSPIRMLYFLSAPLPWYWRGLEDVFAFVFSASFYMLSVYEGIKAAVRTKSSFIVALLIICACSALIFAWGVNNAGSALRHRDKFIAVYLCLLISSLSGLRAQRAKQTTEVQGDVSA